MKILFLSDIHGVPSALEQALAAAEPLGCDRIVLLGDLLYHGPRNGVPDFYDPVKVVAILNSLKEKIIAVRGNCDAEVDRDEVQMSVILMNAACDRVLTRAVLDARNLDLLVDKYVKTLFEDEK